MRKNFVNRATEGNNVADRNCVIGSRTRKTVKTEAENRGNSRAAKKNHRATAEAVLAAIEGTNLCMITDSDENAPIVVTEQLPYDVDRSELQPYLQSYEKLDKKRAQLATLISFCRTEPQLVMVANPEKLQDKFEAVCDACEKRGREITSFIEQLDSETDRRILTERYLHCYDLDAIAKMHCMRKECVRLAHDTALEELYEIMNDAATEAYLEACNTAVKACSTAAKVQ